MTSPDIPQEKPMELEGGLPSSRRDFSLLREMTAGFASDRGGTAAALDRWMRKSPSEFARQATLFLAIGKPGKAEQHLISVLCSQGLHAAALLDRSLLTTEEAISVAKLLARAHTEFLPELLQLAERLPGAGEALERALQIVAGLGQPWRLTALAQRADLFQNARTRSKLALLIAQVNGNPLWAQRQLKSKDPRVRANAVEGLWHTASPLASGVFREAAKDSNHRVAANGLLGLYYIRDRAGHSGLFECCSHPSPLFRAAVAWAMGRTLDPAFLPSLQSLENDPEPSVRESASRSAKKIASQKLEVDSDLAPDKVAAGKAELARS